MNQIRFIGLDPSTKTGFVALDEDGQVLRAKELTGVGSKDPKRMITLIDNITDHLQKDDFIVIEGFGFSTTQGIMLGGIGWGIRMALARRGFKYIEAAPAAVKKFATGKGNTKKDAMAVPIFKHWGFDHNSDNVRDAYILAKIAENLYLRQIGYIESNLIKYQEEVIQAILNPPVKKKEGEKMTYVMGLEMYKAYTTGKNALKHKELLIHINDSFGIRGEIKQIKIQK